MPKSTSSGAWGPSATVCSKERPTSSGSSSSPTFQPPPRGVRPARRDDSPLIGKSLPPLNAREKVSGSAVYAADMKLPRMLHAKVLRSTYPHARIVHIDLEAARRMPGVKAVLTGADTPKAWGIIRKDEHVLAFDKVRFIGEEVAAVAATDEYAALDAIERIRVEYEELPAVFDTRA